MDGTEIKLNYINFFLKREIVSSLYPPTNLVTYAHTHTHTHTAHTHTAHTHTSPSVEYMEWQLDRRFENLLFLFDRCKARLEK